VKLVIDGKRADAAFDRKMDQLLAFMIHHGMYCGGGWNVKTAHADFSPEPHSSCEVKACTAPILKRITKRERDAVVSWAKKHALNARWQ